MERGERRKTGAGEGWGEGDAIDHVTPPAITSDTPVCFLLHRNAK